MSDRTARPVGRRHTNAERWSRLLVTTTLIASGATLALDLLNRSVQSQWMDALFVLPIGYTLIGALIWRRQPGNAIGPLYAVVGTWLAVSGGLAQSYAIWALLVHPGAPAGRFALWLASPAFDSLFFVPLFLLLQLFPDGRPLTPRWRIVVWSTALGGVLGVGGAFQQFSIDPPLDAYQNPYKLEGGTAAEVLDLVGMGSSLLLLFGALGSVASVVLRFRRARGIERLQLRWFAAAVVAVLLMAVGTLVVYILAGTDLSNALFPIAVLIVPAAVAVAILRYRLYEIDVLIRRTITYAVLVVVLGAGYLGGIWLLGGLLRSLTGASGAVAVTITTLAVWAAFQPLRAHVQASVDRRFARRRYDAAHALAGLSSRLRDRVELESIEDELLELVDATVQPRHASVWLRPAERP